LNLLIRPAIPDDAPALARILIGLGWWKHMSPEKVPEIEERIRAGLERPEPGRERLVAVDDPGEILGYTAVHWVPYLFLEGPEGYVTELFIAETARGQGIGSRLLERVKELALKKGCVRLRLLSARESEAYKRGFYANRGWNEWGQSAIFVYDLTRDE
jgi:GNAT superfamily N-acetyltransferase